MDDLLSKLKIKSYRYLLNVDDYSKVNLNNSKFKIISSIFNDYSLKKIHTKCKCKYCDEKIEYLLNSKITNNTLCLYCIKCNNIFK